MAAGSDNVGGAVRPVCYVSLAHRTCAVDEGAEPLRNTIHTAASLGFMADAPHNADGAHGNILHLLRRKKAQLRLVWLVSSA